MAASNVDARAAAPATVVAGPGETDRQARFRPSGPPRRVRAAITIGSATAGLAVGRLVVEPRHVVFVKGVVEASDGLACVFAERGGDLCIASPPGREAELHELLADLSAELGGAVEIEAPRDEGARPSSASPR